MENLVSEELKNKLMSEYGMSKVQVNSSTVEKVVRYFMESEEDVVYEEKMRELENADVSLRASLNLIRERERIAEQQEEQINKLEEKIVSVEERFGEIKDKRAITAIQLFNTIAKCANEFTSREDSAKYASYAVYAYLAGRIGTGFTPCEEGEQIDFSFYNPIDQRKAGRRR